MTGPRPSGSRSCARSNPASSTSPRRWTASQRSMRPRTSAGRRPMADSLEQVLRLVADGRLTAEQAAPILDALGSLDDEPASGAESRSGARPDEPATSTGQRANALRIEVTEDGRRVVNLRI